MSAEILRAAADRLDEAIDRLSTDTAVWDEQFPVVNVYADQSSYGRLIMHPEVGEALAVWLRFEADAADKRATVVGIPQRGIPVARTVANLILGGSHD